MSIYSRRRGLGKKQSETDEFKCLKILQIPQGFVEYGSELLQTILKSARQGSADRHNRFLSPCAGYGVSIGLE
jgi:hypothetical protein